jgi:hypothetical protein
MKWYEKFLTLENFLILIGYIGLLTESVAIAYVVAYWIWPWVLDH